VLLLKTFCFSIPLNRRRASVKSGVGKHKTHWCNLLQRRTSCAKLGDVQVEGVVIEMEGIVKNV